MKQKTIATRHLRTKIAAGYVLILFVIFGIVYIWLNEQNRQQELEATTYKIRKQKADNTALKFMFLFLIFSTEQKFEVGTFKKYVLLFFCHCFICWVVSVS